MGLAQTFVPYLLKDRERKEPSPGTIILSVLHVSFIGQCLVDAFFYDFWHSHAIDYLKHNGVTQDGSEKIFIIH